MFIGGIAENFESSYRIGGGREFVIEGDEYDSAFFDKTAKFLKYLPDIAVVNNIEFDHADIYPDLESIRLAFRRFVNLVPRRGLLLLGADNADALALGAQRALPGRDVRALRRRRLAGARPAGRGRRRRRSACAARGQPIGTFEVPLLGAYNVRNALAAIAVGRGRRAEPRHDGRRACARSRAFAAGMQLRGTARGVAVYDDFAHHPTAIAETLPGVRSAYPDRRIWAIFEPRSATSCRRVFQEDFAQRASRAADRVVLPAVFRSTLPEDQRLSTEQLVADLKAAGIDARYIPKVDDIVAAGRQGCARRRPRRRHVERRLRRHPSEAPVGARGARDLIDARLRIVPAGDAAWLVELPERIDPAVNARAVALARAVEAPGAAGDATSSSAIAR